MVQLFERYIPVSSLVDVVIESLLGLTAFTLAVQAVWWVRPSPDLPGPIVGKALISVGTLVLVFYVSGYYERRHHLSIALYLPRLLQAIALAGATLTLLYTAAPSLALSWQEAGAGLLLLGASMVAWHAMAPALADVGGLTDNVLILGEGSLAGLIAERIDQDHPWGFRLAGCLQMDSGRPDGSRRPADFGGSRQQAVGTAREGPGIPSRAVAPALPDDICPVLGDADDLSTVLDDEEIRTVVVALTDRRGRMPMQSLIAAKLRGVTIYDAADFYERLTGRMLVARLRPSSIIFSEGFSPSRLTRTLKRGLDVLLAITLLVATVPLMALIALAIRLDSPGPVLFRQERVGEGGELFTILKFRSMYDGAEADGPRWAAEGDRRVTRVGALIRKLRLDELPQFWNVLLGDMSFVGPRPERPCFVRWLREEIPYYDQRHTVRPGITGWAQVKYPYGASAEESQEKLEHDLYYIKHVSISFDLTILMETVRVVLWGKGAR